MKPTNEDRTEQEHVIAQNPARAPLSAWSLSPEVWLLVRPTAAYEWLAALPDSTDRWAALRRPVFVALLFGCMVSLVTSQRLTLRHVAGGAVSASLLLAGQIAALRIVSGRNRRFSFSRTIDLFFAGYGPWAVWIIAFSAVWAFASTEHAYVFAGPGSIVPTAGFAALWSCYIDFRFFERALQRTRARALWDVFWLRTMSWTVCIGLLGYGTLWVEWLRVLGR